MGLLSFLFSKETKPKKSIFDLFQIDLKELPDSSFIDCGIVKDKDGQESRLFTKILDYQECGIFSEIEVSIFDNQKAIELSSKPSKNFNVKKFCELANSLYRMYGNDINNEGMITGQEINEYITYGGVIARFWYQGIPWISISSFSVDENIIRSLVVR
jgi:hypothetical protein